MSWYYFENEQQVGPVEQEVFAKLTAEGKITPQTLVWKEGMAEWLPYSQVSALTPASHPPVVHQPTAATTHPTTTAAGGETVVCSVSGKTVPKSEAVEISGKWVSRDHKAEFLQKLKEGASLPNTFHYGGFWIRVGAKMIDGFILAIPTYSIMFGVMYYTGTFSSGAKAPAEFPQSLLLIIVTYILPILLQASYSIYFIGKKGATLGKMACGLKVIMADGRPLGYGRATGRFFAEMLSSFTLGIGFLIAAFDAQKRTLHDHICGTRVVKK